MDINREHPEYKSKRSLWRRYRDLYIGGEQMIRNAGEYLLPRRKEPSEIYFERLQHVFYQNYIGSIVDWYAATVFRREPLVTIDGSNTTGRDFFSEFIDDCDLKGTHLADVLRRVFVESLVCGTSYVLVDFPRTTVPAGNRAEEDARGVSRAYLVPYTAEDLINWSYDEHGNFDWVVVRSERFDNGRVEDRNIRRETRWTYYDKTTFAVYRQLHAVDGATSSIERIDAGFHGLASLERVPLFRMELPEGLWMLNKAGSLQLEHFNKSNALSWALSMGLYAMPVVYSDRKWDQMVGESYFIQLSPEDKFGWTEPEGRVYEIAADNLARLQGEIYRVCYVSQLAAGDSSQRQSGLSKLRDFSITQEVLRAFGDVVKDLAMRLLRTIELVRADDLTVDVSGMDEFDIGDFGTELQNARELLQMGIQSPTLVKQIQKHVALKYLSDVRQDIKDRIAAEIDGQ